MNLAPSSGHAQRKGELAPLATGTSLLNLRLETSLLTGAADQGASSGEPSDASRFSLQHCLDVASPGRIATPPLQTEQSTASSLSTVTTSLPDTLAGGRLVSLNTLGSGTQSISLWDLRAQLKATLERGGEAKDGSDAVLLPREVLQQVLGIMREHLQHRKVQRGLKQGLKASEASNASLRRQNELLQRGTATRAARAVSPGAGPRGAAGKAAGDAQWARARLGARGDADSASSFTGAKAGLATGESVDVRSTKSDGSTGDEVDTLRGRIGGPPAPTPDVLKQALHALAEERRRNQGLELRLEAAQQEAEDAQRHLAAARAADEERRSAPRASNLGFLWGNGRPSTAAGAAAATTAAAAPDDAITESLVAAKIALAEAEGQLTESKREASRCKVELHKVAEGARELAAERDRAWEEVGLLMVQVHCLQERHALMQKYLADSHPGETPSAGSALAESVGAGGSAAGRRGLLWGTGGSSHGCGSDAAAEGSPRPGPPVALDRSLGGSDVPAVQTPARSELGAVHGGAA